MGGLPQWAARGMATGVTLGLPLVVGVTLALLVPGLRYGFSVLLLPLLAAGPLAADTLPRGRALAAALLAGSISAILAAGSLAVAGFVLAFDPSDITSKAAAITWTPVEILVLQPVTAALLGMLSWSIRQLGTLAPDLPGPRSARTRLVIASCSMLLFILGVGWIGYAPVQAVRSRGLVRSAYATWNLHLADIDSALDAQVNARLLRGDDSAQVAAVRQSIAQMTDSIHAARGLPPAVAQSLRERYGLATGLLAATYEAHLLRPADSSVRRSFESAVNVLRRQIHEDQAALAVADAQTTRWSQTVLAVLIGVAGAAGLWLGQWTVGSIGSPLVALAAHLSRISRGDLSRRSPDGGTEELASIASSADTILDDLIRLYAIERAGRAAAEIKTIQEQLLTRASTALVAATDADRIFQIAVKSAVALARQPGKVRATVAVGPLDKLAVVAADGEATADVLHAQMDIRGLFDIPNPELQQRRFRALDMGMPVAIARFGFRPKLGAIILTTLRVRNGKLTVIMLESDDALGDECAEGLAKLGVDVALALDSAAFQADMLVKRSEARFRSLVQNSTDVVMIVRPDGVIQYQSPSGEHVLGYTGNTLVGTNLRDLIHPSDLPKLQGFMADMLKPSRRTPRVEWRVHRADGSWIHAETIGNNLLQDPDVAGLVLNSRDIGERRALQDQLTYQAFHDPLTTLPNRALFMDRLERAMIRAGRRERNVAMLFLDLDNFKVVNDSLGHQAGDEMLIEAARRLLECVRAEDTVARLGGDEFTILIEDANSMENALEVARRIELRLREPFSVLGREVFSTASIGIAVSGPGVTTAADLLRDADLAMYRAKSEGKSRHVVFDSAMNTQAMKRLELETALRRAVERGELRLVYQPIMSLDHMGIDRVETLVRWLHPERGLISPADFIPLAEETGLIVPIGQWVLHEACQQAQQWHREYPGASDLVLSVNLSPRQFQHPTLVEDIARIISETGLDPERLELEITEGAVMEDADAARATLQRLRDIGIHLAIDDFGTGYSSLGYLKRFPVGVLKIDQSFVRGLGHDEQDSAIVHGVIALAQSLNLSVTAEGIETLEQLARLRDLGCNHGQGYLLSRPLAGDALGNLLARSTVQLPSPKHGILRDTRIAS